MPNDFFLRFYAKLSCLNAFADIFSKISFFRKISKISFFSTPDPGRPIFSSTISKEIHRFSVKSRPRSGRKLFFDDLDTDDTHIDLIFHAESEFILEIAKFWCAIFGARAAGVSLDVSLGLTIRDFGANVQKKIEKPVFTHIHTRRTQGARLQRAITRNGVPPPYQACGTEDGADIQNKNLHRLEAA